MKYNSWKIPNLKRQITNKFQILKSKTNLIKLFSKKFYAQAFLVKDKGVSEVVGYLLVFSIVVTIVSVVYAAGMPVVEKTKDTSAVQSMETVFLTLQSNMKKVALAQSPVRTMKLNLIKGSVSANETAGDITVTVGGNDQTIQFGNIEYTLGTRKIVYENGAVIESTSGGSIIASDPPIFFTNDSGNAQVFISVINVSGTFSAGGGVAEMKMGPYNATRDTYVYNSSSPVNSVNISIESSYAHAWSLFLNNSYTDTFGNDPNAGFDEANNFCWLEVSKSCNLTLVTHNVTVS